MKRVLTVSWQRLVDERGRTCPRCGKTGGAVEEAVASLARRLRPQGITVRATSRELSRAAFDREPSSSNCRTLEAGGKSYAAVPARLIVEAGLKAARAMAERAPKPPARRRR